MEKSEQQEVVIAYKGFEKDMTCRGFQYEIGQTYEHDGDVEACSSGFHACEYPLDVFGYYPPATSQFALVEQFGKLSRHDDDSKVASQKITIKASLDLPGIIKAAIEYTFSRAKPIKGGHSTGYQGAASATGTRGAAMSSGWKGRAMGAEGCALFLVERADNDNILAVWAGIAGHDGIKPNVWYQLINGKPVEVN